jgi:translation elongation factor EF-4
VFCERLESEYGIGVVTTRPTVPFKVVRRGKKTVSTLLDDDEDERVFDDPSQFPHSDDVQNVDLLEPRCVATIVCPASMQVGRERAAIALIVLY